ncbi:MAG: hypothetical protein KKA05_10520 [Alphaproteobacteria bacterium]|nr:hypothetical protein [Alphaproteobacteria bacterium]
MPKGKRSPGVGHNSGAPLAKKENILRALAIEILDKERIQELQEVRKLHRKSAEGQSIVLEDLDRLHKMKDMSGAEIEIWFRRQWNTMGSFFSALFEQYELFAPKAGAPEVEAANRHLGQMAGLTGKPGTPPPQLVGRDQQIWLEGYGDGLAHRNAGKALLEEEDADRMSILKRALDNAEAGVVTDGTAGSEGAPAGKPKPLTKAQEKAKAAAAQAKADFERDNPGVPIPGADALPGENTKPTAPADDTPKDDFEATEEELAGQTGRKAVVDARKGATSGEPDQVEDADHDQEGDED